MWWAEIVSAKIESGHRVPALTGVPRIFIMLLQDLPQPVEGLFEIVRRAIR